MCLNGGRRCFAEMRSTLRDKATEERHKTTQRERDRERERGRQEEGKRKKQRKRLVVVVVAKAFKTVVSDLLIMH